MKSESEWCLLAKQYSNDPIWLASKIWTSFAFSDGNAKCSYLLAQTCLGFRLWFSKNKTGVW